MNTNKLTQAEMEFYARYPSGFNSPEMQLIGKKHKMDKMVTLTHELFAEQQFENTSLIIDSMVKVVSRSSMISVFEKPRFRDVSNGLSSMDKEMLASALYQRLHGKRELGFECIVEILLSVKLAKWSLISIIPAYYYPDDEVFIKPTTTKGIINHFELTDVTYNPKPSWEFYQKYSQHIFEMKRLVNSDLAPNNAAFCGFLMMSMGWFKDEIS